MPSGNYFVHTLLRARDWQHRPEFDQVCDWWHGGGRGVCALVGMGGAGKTAIAERFLSAALDGNTEPEPHSVFVYSFYDDDKPENLFRRLQIWLEGSPKLERELSVSQIMFLVQQHQGLIILDGLEMVQESGARGGFGRLTSPSLRDLLNHIASGSARELSVLVTSRFPLTDLRDSQPRYFHTIDIDEIEVEAGIALLRSRGVRGTDVQLAPIVEHCGRHALTVDLAGGYIKEYGHGDPATPLNLGTADELRAEAEQEPDDNKRAVLKQGVRFARIAQRYREAMLNSDEAALALLERVCLFRLGVDCETLAAIFTGPRAVRVAGKALAGLSSDQLLIKLKWLVRMGIVEASVSTAEPQTGTSATVATPERPEVDGLPNGQRRTIYTVHPAVRSGFLAGISPDAARSTHKAVRYGLEALLGGDVIKNPADSRTLDLLEEVIHHTLECGEVNAALNIYQNRIGGFRNFGWLIGAYERGDRICRQLLANFLPRDERVSLLIDWGVYLKQLGRLGEAVRRLQDAIVNARLSEDWENVATGEKTLSDVWLQVGAMKSTIESATEALRAVDVVDKGPGALQPWIIAETYARRGFARVARGDLLGGMSDFRDAFTSQNQRGRDQGLYTSRGVRYAQVLVALGRSRDALRQLKANRSFCLERYGLEDVFTPRMDLVLCGNSSKIVDRSVAMAAHQSAHSWAWNRDARELLCWSYLVQARMRLSVDSGLRSIHEVPIDDELSTAQGAISHGLKIARDCGYGLYHIDLLLEQARLHLLRGDANAALDDIELALDSGIPANDRTGQPELLAATDEECGYAWGIVEGLHLRGEAMLLQAAQTLGSESFDPAERDHLPSDVSELVAQAESCLNDAMNRWRNLRDPEPTEDNNFVHRETGVEYNYRAEETYQILKDLVGGVLTKYPLTCLAVPDGEQVYLRGENSVEGLLKITGCENPDRDGDVVFVHGLDGDAKTTWHPKGKPDDFWPAWLGEDLPNVGVWSLGYEVSSSAWKGDTMPLSDRATHTLALLETQGFGRRPIVFICHSLGGLLAKQLLRHSNDFGSDEWKMIVAQTRGIVFLSTPHSGADMANWIKYIGTLLRTTVTVDELKAHDPRLRELNTWYRNNVGGLGIKTQAYCEKKKVAGILVVNETSADPGLAGVVPIPMDDDHISICKPVSKESLVYLRVKQFVEALFANP